MAAFAMIGIITVFIIFVVFYMIVSHKSKDIGILKSVGVVNGDVIKLFMIFAFLIGVLGSAIGTAGGVVFLLKINQLERWLYTHYGFQLWNRIIYAIDDIPNKIEFDTIATIVILAIITCLAGAFVPSWQGSRLNPVETLQVNQI
jgi:lipoprotein-releasing system permease protein